MSASIVIALPKLEDAKKIRALLQKHGYVVAAVCNTGAHALESLSSLECGVLICGYHLTDMYYRDVLEYMPKGFELLLVASPKVVNEAPRSIMAMDLPLKVQDFLQTLNVLINQIERRWKREHKKPRVRSEKEKNYISNAKMMLMQKNQISEEEAFRYIQKCSMDTGTNMVETAQMLLMLLFDEE